VEINVRKHSDVQVIKLRGDLKMGNPVDDLRQLLEELFAAGDMKIVIDLAEVQMVDSSGIGVLVRNLASAKQRGGSLKLVNPSKLTQQTLKMVGLLPLFEVFTEDETAVASFG
jgi:anti-sigma B factor antagonist